MAEYATHSALRVLYPLLRELREVQVFQCPEPDEISPQNRVVMQNDLLGGQQFAVPGAVAVAHQYCIEAKTARAPAGRVDTEFGLRSSDDQASDICGDQFLM